MLRRRAVWCAVLILGLAACSRKPSATPEALLANAKSAIAQKQIPAAIQALEELFEQQPDHSEALLYRAQLAREAGDEQAALGYVRRIPADSGPHAATKLFFEGSLLLARGEAVAAERLWREAITLRPSFLQPRGALVELFLTQHRGKEVRGELLDLQRIRPLSLVQLVQYQASYTELARPDGSRKTLERYLQSAPDDRDTLIALVRDLLAENELDRAAALLRERLERSREDDSLRGLLIETLVRGGHLDEASRLAGSGPPAADASLWQWRGAALLADARSDAVAAAAAWWQVVERTPDDRNANYRLAVTLDRSGRADDAKVQFQRTRAVELLIDHVSHILKGDTRQTALVGRMAKQIAQQLIVLDRPEDAALWLELLLRQTPADEDLARLARRLADTAAAAAKRADQRRELGAALLSRARAVPQLDHGGPESAQRRELPELASASACPIRLEDQHAAAGITFQHFNGPTEFRYLLESLGGAAAVLDFDQDGWPDLYLPDGCNIPYAAGDRSHLDRLYHNRGDGTFREVGSTAAIDENRYSQGVSAGDFNNDGLPDIAIGSYGGTTLYENNGDGTFSDLSDRLGPQGEHWNASLAWSDLDRDGDLDLYVVNYVLEARKVCRTPEGVVKACSPGNFAGEDDLLYLNAGDGTFQNVPLAAAGLEAAEGKGLGIVVAHLDGDDWPDLYVSNDGTPNFLFRHTGEVVGGIPQFRETGFESGAAVSADGRSQAGMGIACGDLNGDLLTDLYVTHFYNDYNTLYLNRGEGVFEDDSQAQGLVEPTMRLLGFGTQPIDFDLDGWPDLLVANGHIDNFESEGIPWKMPLQLFWNRRGAGWSEVGGTAGEPFAGKSLGRGVVRWDYDRDGRPDALVVHQDRPVSLLRNATPRTGKSLSLRLIGKGSNREALGARVFVEIDGRTGSLELIGGDGYFASNERTLQFGTGTGENVGPVRIVWPDGETEVRDGMKTGPFVIVQGTEPQPLPCP